MVKKIMILIVVLLLAAIFYKKYMAQVLEPFFKEKSGNVDFFQYKASDYLKEQLNQQNPP